MNEANLPGHAIGYINFASLLVGTPVVNAHNLKLAITGIDDAHPGAERQVWVGGCQRLRVELLATGGFFAVEVRPIPTGVPDPGFDWLNWGTQMGDQRRFHAGGNKEHQGNPTNRSPYREECSSHSVFFSQRIFN